MKLASSFPLELASPLRKIGCPFVLVLVVVLVLDVLGFCGEKEIPSIMILFYRSDGETSAFSSTTCGLRARARVITLFATASS